MAQYPSNSNIDWTDSTVVGQGEELLDQQDVNFAEHVNEIRGEVKAIASELGANPRGAQSTVRARLENIESTKSNTTHNHDSAYVARSVLTGKGNVLTATGASTPAAFGPGGNGTVLMFDSSQSTGLRAKSLDHGDDLGGLGDDDHPHYHNAARHALVNHAGLSGVPPYPFVGMVVDSARPDVPAGWLECNGQSVSRITYADLFAAIDTQYGADDANTFKVPNTVGRVRLHLDPGRTAWNTLGKTGGAETVALVTAQLPSHSHTTNNHSHGSGTLSSDLGGSHSHKVYDNASYNTGWSTRRAIEAGSVSLNGTWNSLRVSTDVASSHTHSVSGTTAVANPTTNNTGSGNAHENMPPYMVFKALIFAGA